MVVEEFCIDIAGQSLSAKRWHDQQGLPVLALHGWLDNAASFDFIAPLLPDLNLVCLDLAGHGLSSHRQDFASYTLWRDVIEIFAFADAMGWQKFALLGHSRGAAIASLMAATFPERITHLGLIEGVFPIVNTNQQGPDQLRQCIQYLNRPHSSKRSVFPCYESAIAARVNGLFNIRVEDAQALAARALLKTDAGYQWNYDTKLKAPSEVRMQKQQVDAYFELLSMPSSVILGDSGFFVNNHEWTNWLNEYPEIKQFHLLGGHHLHMSENAKAVAGVLHAFYC